MAIQSKEPEVEGAPDLMEYINEQTLKDEYIRWSLVDVVTLWHASAMLLGSGKSDESINADIYSLIVEWISFLPISSIWSRFSRLEMENELKGLEQFIFDNKSKETFAERLTDRYPKYAITIGQWGQKQARQVW